MASFNANRNADVADERQGGRNVSHNGRERLDAMTVKLVSNDNHEFIVSREEAMVSATISAMLSGPGNYVERRTNVIRFPLIRSDILKIICDYFKYKKLYENTYVERPPFPISPEISLELLLAAHYLQC